MSVEQVADARAVLRGVPKDPDARWVAGLETEIEGGVEPGTMAGPSALHKAPFTTNRDQRIARARRWLAWPTALLLLGLAAALAQLLVAFDDVNTFDHPTVETQLWPYARQSLDEVILSYVVRSAPHLLMAVGAAAIAIKLGAASESFTAFCGVGCALLAVAAVALDGILLLRACGSPTAVECDYPFGSHWFLSFFRWVGPLAAVACVAPTIDVAVAAPTRAALAAAPTNALVPVGQASPNVPRWRRFQWLVVALTALVAQVLFYAAAFFTDADTVANAGLVACVRAVHAAAWLAIGARLFSLPPITTVGVKTHTD